MTESPRFCGNNGQPPRWLDQIETILLRVAQQEETNTQGVLGFIRKKVLSLHFVYFLPDFLQTKNSRKSVSFY
jgi:hypothetical protein